MMLWLVLSSRFRCPRRLILLLASVALVLTCVAAAPFGATAGTGGDLKIALAFTGGKAGQANAKLAPITIGFVNQQGGIPSAPEGTVAAKAAVAYVNRELGGIHGHPLKLKTCFIVASEEQGQVCAQQMANDKSVVLVNEGTTIVGASSFHQTLAGKLPVFAYVPVVPADTTATNTFMLNAGNDGIVPGMATYILNYLHAKSVAVLGPSDDPAAVAGDAALVAMLEQAGVKVQQASFPATQSDLVAPIVASGAQTADAVCIIVNNPGLMIAAAKAFDQLQITAPIISVGLALQPAAAAALGDYPKWTYTFLTLNPSASDKTGRVAVYLDAMKKYGGKNPVLTSTAPAAFASILTSARILNAVYPNLTSAAISAKTKAFKGPGFLFPPHYNFGFKASEPALGTLETRFYTYAGKGKWVDATNGHWIKP